MHLGLVLSDIKHLWSSMISKDYIKDLTAAAIQWRKSDHSQSAYIYNHLLQNPENKVGIFNFFVHRQFFIFSMVYNSNLWN